jgi:O-antigen/teichoic acid export membrane protein
MHQANMDTTRTKSGKTMADSIYLVSANILSTAFSLIAGLLLARALLPDQYGRVAHFLKLFGLARFIGTLGLGAKVIEDVACQSTLGNKLELGRTVWSLALIRLMTSCTLLLCLAVLTRLQGDSAFIWAGIASLIASLTDYTSVVSQGLRKRQVVAWLSLTQPSAYLLGTAFLWLAHLATPARIYAVFTASFVPTFLLYLLSLRHGFIPPLEGSFLSLRYLGEALNPLLAFFMFGILNYLYQSLGILVLGQARLFEDAAYFNAALTWVTMPETIALIVLTAVLYPDMVAAMAQNKQKDAARLFDAFLRAALVALSWLAGVYVAHAGFVIRFFYTDTYSASVIVLTIAAPLTLLLFLQQILIFGLYALKKPSLASKGMAIQILITLVGTYFVVTKYTGNRAAGLAAVYTLACMTGFLIHWADVKRLLRFRMTLSRVLSFGLFSIAIVTLAAKSVSLIGIETSLLAVLLEILMSLPLYIGCVVIILLYPQERNGIASWLSLKSGM